MFPPFHFPYPLVPHSLLLCWSIIWQLYTCMEEKVKRTPKNEVLAAGVSPMYKGEVAAHSELQFVKFLIDQCDFFTLIGVKCYHPDQLKTLQIVNRSVRHILSDTIVYVCNR